MDIIKKILRTLLIIVSGLFILFSIGSFGAISNNANNLNIIIIIFIVIIGVVLLSLGGGGLFLVYSLPKRCKQCKKWFAIQKGTPVKTQSKRTNVIVENQTRSAYDGKVTSTTEQRVPGTRNVYKTSYVCKYCGAEKYCTYKTVDIPD